MVDYNFREIETKWQRYWEENEVYRTPNLSEKPKYYILDMFPYPSGAGLHVGHPLGYIASDIIARYKRLRGFNVLHPMGFDSFGLPAEQYAIQTGQHPAVTTAANINRYKEQLKSLGLSYDWTREIQTSDPSFYKWTQWIFQLIYNSWYNKASDRAEPIELLIEILEKEGNASIDAACDDDTPLITAEEWSDCTEKEQASFLLKYRLAYLSDTAVNWCPALGTVLSNDEVKEGFSERGGHPVIKKKMSQWSMRITAYADRLLSSLETIDWPEPVREIQRNWIGKSFGAEIDFQIENTEKKIRVFTTRIDTIFGVTFMVLAPENGLVASLTKPEQKEKVDAYAAKAKNRSERDRMSDAKTITGVFTGSYVVHPFSGEKVPVWVADYVLAGYGTGAVMAVPCGDQRDFDFAKHFDLPIVQINDAQQITATAADPTREGRMINSGFLNGLTPEEAIRKGIEEVEKRGIGTRKANFKLRDAVFGRQRYWGEPIPVYYKNETPHLVDDQELPLELPSVDEYLPTEGGDPPLGRAGGWNHRGNPYELSTMPGWAGSSWYFFRYMDPNNENVFCSREALDYWQEVDLYMGGSEHATGHLLYSRFWTKFLFDRGYIKVEEYAGKLVNQGMIQGRSNFIYRVKGENKYVSKGLRQQYDTVPIHVDVSMVKNDVLNIEAFKQSGSDVADAVFVLEGGEYICGREVEKMSKSKFNIINPDDLIAKYGADTLRMYEMFLGPIEQSKPWSTNGIEGVFKFLRKYLSLFYSGDSFEVSNEKAAGKELKILHAAIKKVAEDAESLSLNTSVSTFMITVNALAVLKCNKREVLEPLTVILSPFAPHITEEIWSLLGNKDLVVNAAYPELKEEYLAADSIEYPITVNGKMRAKINLPANAGREEVKRVALAHEVIQKWVDGKTPKRVIVVPGKIVNIVI